MTFTITRNAALIIWLIAYGFILFEFGVCIGLWLALYDKKEINRLLLWELAEVKKMKYGKVAEEDKEANS